MTCKTCGTEGAVQQRGGQDDEGRDVVINYCVVCREQVHAYYNEDRSHVKHVHIVGKGLRPLLRESDVSADIAHGWTYWHPKEEVEISEEHWMEKLSKRRREVRSTVVN